MAPQPQSTPAPVGPIFVAARQVHAASANHQPKGMLEVRTAAYEAPFSIAELAAAYDLVARACAKQPVRPEWAAAVATVVGLIQSAAQAAQRLGPSFDDLHPIQVRRLLAPQNGEQMWDTTANRP